MSCHPPDRLMLDQKPPRGPKGARREATLYSAPLEIWLILIGKKKEEIVTTSIRMFMALALAFAGTSGAQANEDPYSTSALVGLCGEAQSIVTSSDLNAGNAVYSTWDGFVQSDADPYSVVGDNPPLEYSPPEAPDLLLSATQHVFYGGYRFGARELPTVVSCKMKNAEYLNARDSGLGAVDQPCQAVAAQLLGEVMSSLTWLERRRIGQAPILEEDITAGRGSEWTAGFPDRPYPVLYRESVGGPVHIKSSALYVAAHPTETIETACNPIPPLRDLSFCEPRKWGVRYCHLPSPEYIRAAITGRASVPTCGTDTADPRVCQD